MYLTFDCGYENGFTPQILDTLAAHHAQAMFFVTKAFIPEMGSAFHGLLGDGISLSVLLIFSKVKFFHIKHKVFYNLAMMEDLVFFIVKYYNSI